ncbi:MAG: phage holin family protein [Deltaproteobacteria bacterium]|nr:phage holin family protein [Deltaproteobacteria bacterium]
MKNLLLRWIINGFSIILASLVLKGIILDNFMSAFTAGALLGIFNAVIRPILIILTLPVNILTLGLFTLVINGFMLWLVGSVIKGFEVTGFIPAVSGALFISAVSLLVSLFIKD